MRNIVVGILYRGVEDFLPDYIKSINSQTTRDFELFLFDNGFPDAEAIKKLFDKDIFVRVIKFGEKSDSIVPIRKFILEYLKKEKNVKNVIFTDTDDFFDSNRFEKTIKALEKEEIVFTDLEAVDKEGKKLERPLFLEGIKKVTFADMVDKNMLGFSHTALKWKHLVKVFPYHDDLIVGDWWFFISLLSQGLVAQKVEGCLTYYRQYGGNIAGIKKKLSSKGIDLLLKIKLALYSNLLNHLSTEKYEIINEKLAVAKKLRNEFQSFREDFDKHIEELRKKDDKPYWWGY